MHNIEILTGRSTPLAQLITKCEVENGVALTFANSNDLVRQVAHERGRNLVLWDFDSGDSTGSTLVQSNKAYDALIKSTPRRSLL
jgi:hypothetical protein